MLKRPRRLRQNSAIRSLVQETYVRPEDFVMPLFILDKAKELDEVPSMPGVYRYGEDNLLREVEELVQLGIKSIVLFPVTDPSLKSEQAEESYNPKNLTARRIAAIKKRFLDDILVMTDIALDPYTTHGHDGLIKNNRIDNDSTLEVLTKMALMQAEAGADILGPSDMMDGRVAALRQALEKNDFNDVMIMSYTAKYASCLYGPFREALDSENYDLDPNIPKDKASYQMSFTNSRREALTELSLDQAEGADILMVKPASWYLDIIAAFKERTNHPVAAYQVSGEYAMLMQAINAGFMDRKRAISESLSCIKRAGADIILSYLAKEYCKLAI
jgi:porphobilinogen synthase